jgi:hypothetical protein
MATSRQPRPPSPPPADAVTGERKRIPLPPLPHFRGVEAKPPAIPAEPAGTRVAATVAPPGAASARPRVATPAAAAPAGSVSHLEMSELLSPGHEGGITPIIEGFAPQRTGSTGATILNNLVDEIEKDLERDLARIPLEIAQQHYRRVVPCSFGPGAAPERRARE